MMKHRGIAFKLIVLVMASVSVIFLAIFGYNYFYSRSLIVKHVEENAKNLARATVNRIDEVLLSIEQIPRNAACYLEITPHSASELEVLLGSLVSNNSEICGAAIAFEPYAFDVNTQRHAPYFYKDKSGGLLFADLGTDQYGYFFQDWYQIPKELEEPVWSEPYYDEGGGNIVMSTYSVPFFKREGNRRHLAGIITADISLSWLRSIVSSIRIGETGYGFVITRNGTFVAHPDSTLIMNETLFSLAEAHSDANLRKTGRDMIHGKSGFVPFRSTMTEKMCWMVYAPLKSSGWSIGVLFPQDELMADITRMNRTVILIGVVGFFFLFTVVILIAGTITKPLRLLAATARSIATGDLDIDVPTVATGDEVGELAHSFDHMKNSLKQYINDLTETTAAKERIESELKIAHDIQMGILPKVFPPFPDMPEFDLHALIEPAREVGGDLYDFFFLDDEHLCFHVGDVSGKGVPASLFMAITRTLIKTKAEKGITPEEILERVNRDLSIDNPSLLFVTLFLGILNIRTGELRYCNGGHNPPYLVRADGNAATLAMSGGMALGVMEDFVYQSKTVTLSEGDTIVVYTDGVTEAMNEKMDLFSDSRLEEAIMSLRSVPVQGLIEGILEKVKEFCHDVEQTDDITMLVIRFNG